MSSAVAPAFQDEHVTNQPIDRLDMLDVRRMRLAIAKERLRCDRYDQYFSLIVTELHCSKSAHRKKLAQFADILSRRLRLSDEFGLLEQGQIAMLLPMTDARGAEVVLQSVTAMAAKIGVVFRASITTYPHDAKLLPSLDNDSQDDSTGVSVADLTTIQTTSHSMMDHVPEEFSHTIPVSYQPVLFNHSVELLAPAYPQWKRMFDIAAAGCGLVMASPVMLAAAIGIRLTSAGPVLFAQQRTGQHGKPFTIYKFRTMVNNAEELKAELHESNERDGPAFKMTNDPRVTRFGNLLRKTGLDELPQLLNVLRGEMAIVGPRPLPCEEDAKCERWQRRRLDTKPGLTCFWQISKSRKIPFTEWMRMDIQYSDKRSVWCDISLIAKTCASVVLGRVGH